MRGGSPCKIHPIDKKEEIHDPDISILSKRARQEVDWDYYLNRHVVMADQRLGPMGMIRSEVDRGLGSAEPGVPAPFVAIFHSYYNTMEDLQKAMSAHGAEIMADIPNYTDVQPQIQISEIAK